MYKDPDKHREYQRNRVANIRASWFKDKVCAHCGSSENLELDHIDPTTKITNRIWSWSEIRRFDELAKCQPLCKSCHKVKTKKDKWKPISHGTDCGYTKRKCRCQECTSAHNDTKNAYRARRREKGLPYT